MDRDPCAVEHYIPGTPPCEPLGRTAIAVNATMQQNSKGANVAVDTRVAIFVMYLDLKALKTFVLWT
jgi:hypothetical protein